MYSYSVDLLHFLKNSFIFSKNNKIDHKHKIQKSKKNSFTLKIINIVYSISHFAYSNTKINKCIYTLHVN